MYADYRVHTPILPEAPVSRFRGCGLGCPGSACAYYCVKGWALGLVGFGILVGPSGVQ